MRALYVIVFASLLSITAPMGSFAGGTAGLNPVVNGDFELHTEEPGQSLLGGSALDRCIGVGHQVWMGSGTVEGKLVGSAGTDVAYDEDDPTSAPVTATVTADPTSAQAAADQAEEEGADETARKFAGVDHCVWGDADGYDIAYLNPVRTPMRSVVHWSHQNAVFGDADGDGDREARIPAGAGPGHNMWQAYPSPHQAFTADFDALELDVEVGTVPPNALVQISLSTTPFEEPSPYVVLWLECSLNFPGSLLNAHTTDRHVRVDPALAGFAAREPDCADAKAEWDAADTHERHEVLGKLRIVQVSFWSFNAGTEDVVIDNVSLTNAALAGENGVDTD